MTVKTSQQRPDCQVRCSATTEHLSHLLKCAKFSALPGSCGGSGAGGGRREAAAGGNTHGSGGGAAQQPQAPGAGKLPERSAGQPSTGMPTATHLKANMSGHIAVVNSRACY